MVVGIRQTSRAISAVIVTGVPGLGCCHAEHRERQQRDGCEQEDDRQRDQQDGQRDFVGRFLPLGAFDHGDHAVEKGLAGIDCNAHDDPVGQHARAARDGAEIAAGFADHRRGFAGDGAFVDGAAPSMTSPSAGIVSPASTSTTSPLRSARLIGQLHLGIARCAGQFLGQHFFFSAAQRRGLRLAAAFGERLGKVREQHGEP